MLLCVSVSLTRLDSFCPTGKFPDQGQPIHFDYLQNKCLDVQGAVFANGTPVQM